MGVLTSGLWDPAPQKRGRPIVLIEPGTNWAGWRRAETTRGRGWEPEAAG